MQPLAEPARPPLRRRLDAWFTTFALPIDLTMAVLAIVFLVVGAVDDGAFGAHPGWTPLLEIALWVIFVVEYTARLYSAPDRWRFVRTHVIELLALIATLNFLRALRMFRVLRLLQLLRLAIVAQSIARLFRALDRLGNVVSQPLILVGLVGIIGTVTIGSVALLAAEHALNPAIHDFKSAFWTALSLVTTAGFSPAHAITPVGGAITGAIVLSALIFLQFSISGLAARFERDDTPERLQRLEALAADIHASVARLEALTTIERTTHGSDRH